MARHVLSSKQRSTCNTKNSSLNRGRFSWHTGQQRNPLSSGSMPHRGGAVELTGSYHTISISHYVAFTYLSAQNASSSLSVELIKNLAGAEPHKNWRASDPPRRAITSSRSPLLTARVQPYSLQPHRWYDRSDTAALICGGGKKAEGEREGVRCQEATRGEQAGEHESA